MSLKFNLHEVI